MKPFQLYRSTPWYRRIFGQKPARVWACSACGRLYGEVNKDLAESCCVCSHCGKEMDRKEEYSTTHKRCWSERQAERERQQLEDAQLVTDYDDWVFTDHGWGQDGYFPSPEQAAEELDDQLEDHDDWPEFMFCCREIPFPGLDVGDIIENLTCNMFEEADEHLVGINQLAIAVAEFNKANAGLISYMADRKRKAAIPKPQFDSDETTE